MVFFVLVFEEKDVLFFELDIILFEKIVVFKYFEYDFVELVEEVGIVVLVLLEDVYVD